MLHKQNLKKNPISLAAIPSDWIFWETLGLAHIRTLLSKALLFIDGLTALPEHPNLPELMANALKCVNNYATEDMLKDCIKFLSATDIRDSHLPHVEAFMQLKGILSFYTGDIVEAAKYAGIMADAYFINHRMESDFLSNLFNRIAAIEYARMGNVDKACHHYNQYLTLTGGSRFTPEEVYAAMKYLLTHKQLVRCVDTQYLIEKMQDECAGNLALALKYGKLLTEVKQLPMSKEAAEHCYFDLGMAAAKKSLTNSIKNVLEVDLMTKTAVAKYLADKAAAEAPAPSAPPMPEYVRAPKPR